MNLVPIGERLDRAADTRDRRAAWLWPSFIFALLGMNAAIVAVTVFFAATDQSVATEPDYYAKAMNFEHTARVRESSRALGWTAVPEFRADRAAGTMRLVITLADREGRPVLDADVRAEVFPSARSSQRQQLALVGSASSPTGTVDPAGAEYAAAVRVNRPGLWRIRIDATRRGDEFATECDLLIPGGDR